MLEFLIEIEGELAFVEEGEPLTPEVANLNYYGEIYC